jgi:hypothetical protein
MDAFLFPMLTLRTITATVCLHPIRSSAELPYSIHGMSFSIPYCGPCTKSREIAKRKEIAGHEHEQLIKLKKTQEADGDRTEDDRLTLRSARRRCNLANLAYIQDREQQAERYRKDHGVLPRDEAAESHAEFYSILKASAKPQLKKDTSVRFDDMQTHRPEEYYRSREQFDRSTSLYEPGLHADQSGDGFYNTCDPYASDLSDDEVASGSSDFDDEEKDTELTSSDDHDEKGVHNRFTVCDFPSRINRNTKDEDEKEDDDNITVCDLHSGGNGNVEEDGDIGESENEDEGDGGVSLLTKEEVLESRAVKMRIIH